jgi:hypothetical protein
MMLAALMLLAQAAEPATTPLRALAGPRAAAPSASTCDQPVIMVVSGPTHDRARMMAYGKAIADSGLYRQLGGYYVNLAFPQEIFEGNAPAGYVTLIVRFPCMRGPSGTARSIRSRSSRSGSILRRATISSQSIPKRRCARI